MTPDCDYHYASIRRSGACDTFEKNSLYLENNAWGQPLANSEINSVYAARI